MGKDNSATRAGGREEEGLDANQAWYGPWPAKELSWKGMGQSQGPAWHTPQAPVVCGMGNTPNHTAEQGKKRRGGKWLRWCEHPVFGTGRQRGEGESH